MKTYDVYFPVNRYQEVKADGFEGISGGISFYRNGDEVNAIDSLTNKPYFYSKKVTVARFNHWDAVIERDEDSE